MDIQEMIEKIRKDTMAEHNILIPPDDPILATILINEKILHTFLETLNQENQKAKEELQSILEKQHETAKQDAGRLITEATNYVKEQIAKAINENLNASLLDTKNKINELNLELQKQIEKTKAAEQEALKNIYQVKLFKKNLIITSTIIITAILISVIFLLLK